MHLKQQAVIEGQAIAACESQQWQQRMDRKTARQTTMATTTEHSNFTATTNNGRPTKPQETRDNGVQPTRRGGGVQSETEAQCS